MQYLSRWFKECKLGKIVLQKVDISSGIFVTYVPEWFDPQSHPNLDWAYLPLQKQPLVGKVDGHEIREIPVRGPSVEWIVKTLAAVFLKYNNTIGLIYDMCVDRHVIRCEHLDSSCRFVFWGRDCHFYLPPETTEELIDCSLQTVFEPPPYCGFVATPSSETISYLEKGKLNRKHAIDIVDNLLLLFSCAYDADGHIIWLPPGNMDII